ncbi:MULTISPECIES: SusC/RagA family TonB-linked outer membrane protein [Butyricimonas]|uniref:TonB-linked SusC/RagA family outer membrane protein n=1 Tax=Butyricimonas faecihominis TaxID=1472416 RepID=A0A7W6HUU2_9BACT|nr:MULTISPECIES: SusC/RagA family TonB-linked outer membrane protein [Butyricimonas]MBB4025376.1 TonB-linked SusC/RagA family outer membrane protein [Butyricimonas faecihominis]MBS6688338.1 SusC/RagA family TonB-linked outer membrane protein [Sanguibacteroides justesenii]
MMKLCTCLLLCSVMSISANVRAQHARMSLELKGVTLEEVIWALEKKSDITFFYNVTDVAGSNKVDAVFKDAPLEKILTEVLRGTNLSYEIQGKVVVIKRYLSSPVSDSLKSVTINGVVKDSHGNGLPGVTVVLKGTTTGVATANDGDFSITIPKRDSVVLVFSFVGMTTKEVVWKGEKTLNVVLLDEVSEMEEVVITGIFTRKAESFTGAATTFKQADLKRMGNQNILQSLKNMDPSFMVMENVDFGSDPNRTPDIQVRGASSLPNVKGEYESNPNQPLFILDGFEATVEKVFDLDMNRVASVTLLKDAAAKAIYGSRAANGVVVIETIQPEKGKLKVSYSGDLNITTPDLSSYDLCNAKEKLQVEWESGRYKAYYPIDEQFSLEQYNAIEREIARGVNTYWLAKPLRTGVGHKHSLYLEGGDDYLRYGVDLSYNKVAGVMKESSRENVAGAITLSYRYNKMIFRNVLSVAFNRADDSPYGSFSEYTKLNPYWSPKDENGNLKRVLGTFQRSYWQTASVYYNPLYNATLGTKNFSKYTEITNNFYMEWQMHKDLKFIGRFGYTQKQDSREDFYPGNHTKFADWTGDNYFKRGSYYIKDGTSKTLKLDATLNYSKQWDKHLLFANLNWNLQQDSYDYHGMEAWGFLNDKVDHVAFAKQYAENGSPSGDETTTREIGLVGAINYSYDNRYLADLSYRLSGSSVYGSDNRWGGFWSAGIGWNMHYESFMSGQEWLKQLKLRASVGYTGSQNFNPYQAMATYKYFTNAEYDNIVGAYLMGMANDKLKWQRTQDINIGVDAQFFGSLTFRFDYYVSNTDNLLVDFDLSGSTGFNTFKENLGEVQNKGFDATLNWRVYNNTEKDAYFTIFGSVSHNKNKIVKISDALTHSNEAQNDDDVNPSKPFTRFEEGQSTSAIWAVRSLGIDPETGDELFLNRKGEKTYEWNINDQVVCGESNPKFQGNFGFNTEYMGFSLNCSFSYKVGGDYYNQTLVDRVENVDIQYNLDRRVFSGTWKNPGDVTFFKRITETPTTTRPTDRFVERQNELSLASLNLGYDFKHLNISKFAERLKLAFYMTDVFRVSSVKTERGLEYPFARTFSFSLQATF